MLKAANLFKLAMLFLFAFAAERAAGGWITMPAESAFAEKRYETAAAAFSRVPKSFMRLADLRMMQAVSQYEAGRRNQNEELLDTAFREFKSLTESMPFYGRAWLYRAQARLALSQARKEAWSQDDIGYFVYELRAAKERDPNSSWMAFMTGSRLLMLDGRITDEHKMTAMNWLKESLEIRYASQASYQIKDVLDFLWDKYQDMNVILSIMPEDSYSYKKLLEFVDEKHLWRERNSIYAKWDALRRSAYDQAVRKADDQLERGNLALAGHYYQQAFWLDKMPMHARAGRLAAGAAAGKILSEESEELAAILISGDNLPDVLLQALRKRVHQKGDAMLIALQYFQEKNWPKAKEQFEKVDAKQRTGVWRRFYAGTLKELGLTDQAGDVLEPSLRGPDGNIEELVLLEALNTRESDEARQVLESKLSHHMPASKWWGEGDRSQVLEGLRMRKMGLLLKPGVVSIRLQMRGIASPSGEFPYVLIRINSEILGAVYLEGDRQMEFSAKTAGGSKKLELLLLNGTADYEGPGPRAELGPVEVRYL